MSKHQHVWGVRARSDAREVARQLRATRRTQVAKATWTVRVVTIRLSLINAGSCIDVPARPSSSRSPFGRRDPVQTRLIDLTDIPGSSRVNDVDADDLADYYGTLWEASASRDASFDATFERFLETRDDAPEDQIWLTEKPQKRRFSRS